MRLADYQKYIAASRYGRYIEELGRRETWEETVERYIENVVQGKLEDHDDISLLRDSIVNMEVLPSMRCLMTAGPALNRDNVAAFNCSYLPVDHPRAFDETLYILMCGTGVGFSVERQYINKLPEVPEELTPVNSTIKVEDSKRGWAKAFRKLVGSLYAGDIPGLDYSAIRPHGARLKTFGGRASGPAPLRALFEFTIRTFQGARGRKLTSLECHDLMCKIGESVVSGGVRRSALISLSNLSDDRMRHAKDGNWRVEAPHRQLANNSVAYTEKPDFASFLREWTTLYHSYSGERGIFFRNAADRQVRRTGRRETGRDWGTNPCSEIILRPYQFCNLTSVVVRPDDDLDSLLRKVEQATILGTVQATLTDFEYLRPIWKKNTDEEALLGVSLTGIMDHPQLSVVSETTRSWLRQMKLHAVKVNKEWAEKLGINPAAAVTCVKPEGTVSQLTDSASGLHPRYAPYYIRRVIGDVKDPLTTFMISQGIVYEDKDGSANEKLLLFPHKSPDGAICRNDRTAIEQLQHWAMMQEEWCEHKPSITVYYSPEEFLAVGQWVWDHFDILSGVAFLPRDNGVYKQAPYTEITKEEYDEFVATTPKNISWEWFTEDDDNTTGAQTLACVAGACEIP